MDDRQFDALVTTLTIGGGRRNVLRALGGGALAVLAGRFLPMEDVAAKKKHRKKKKKCKGATRKCNGTCIPQEDCCVNADCDLNQICIGGACRNTGEPECQDDNDCQAGEVCVEGRCVPENGECQDAGDCAANESCIAGVCQCAFPQKTCGDACCASDEACVDGQCVVGQGTCVAGDGICVGGVVTCNGNDHCVCGLRLDDDEPRCIQFVNDSRNGCTCNNDFRCEQDFGAGTICIKGGAGCPDCTLENLGRCATLCAGSS